MPAADRLGRKRLSLSAREVQGNRKRVARWDVNGSACQPPQALITNH
ncbi:MAG: hypothetical protein LBD59_08460 [Prevotellaceae bacterium]|jgi:hypothetical protein|nr:hypothetical protein [Prevotellaceae bacterium]